MELLNWREGSIHVVVKGYTLARHTVRTVEDYVFGKEKEDSMRKHELLKGPRRET